MKKIKNLSVVFLVCVCGIFFLTSCSKSVSDISNISESYSDAETDYANEISGEYNIKESCESLCVISNDNETLYGLINSKGKEIMPMIYDYMEFMNKSSVKEGLNKKVYVRARCDGQWGVYNDKGKLILDKNVECLDFKLPESAVVFLENTIMGGGVYISQPPATHGPIRLYDENGKLINEIPEPPADSSGLRLIWINKDYYILSVVNMDIDIGAGIVRASESAAKTCLYDSNNALIKQWDNATISSCREREGNLATYFTVNGGAIIKCTIDTDGNILEEKNIDKDTMNKELWRRGE